MIGVLSYESPRGDRIARAVLESLLANDDVQVLRIRVPDGVRRVRVEGHHVYQLGPNGRYRFIGRHAHYH